jgi:hypothetical protein
MRALRSRHMHPPDTPTLVRGTHGIRQPSSSSLLQQMVASDCVQSRQAAESLGMQSMNDNPHNLIALAMASLLTRLIGCLKMSRTCCESWRDARHGLLQCFGKSGGLARQDHLPEWALWVMSAHPITAMPIIPLSHLMRLQGTYPGHAQRQPAELPSR